MSAISSVSAASPLLLFPAVDDSGADNQAGAPEAVSAPIADPRPASLAPETTAALLAEQAAQKQVSAARIDLSGQDLRGADLTALDLKGADLRGADLSGMNLSGLDLSGANLSDAKLSGAILNGAILTNVLAQRADIRGAALINAAMSGGDFSDSNFSGAYLGAVGKEDSLVGAAWMSVKNANFNGSNFQNAHLRRLGILDASADRADFGGAKMDSVYLSNASLRDANFDHLGGSSVSFENSDVSGSAMTNMVVGSKGYSNTILEGARFAGSSFNHTGFTLTDLRTADLSGVIPEAQFSGFGLTNMSGLDFSGFDFFGAHFNDSPAGGGVTQRVPTAGASYKGTNFSGADFDHASFYKEGDLSAVDFSGAKFNQTMIDNLARSALAGREGLRESQGDAISRAESQAVLDMSRGRRPIERGFRMPDDLLYRASAGNGYALNDQDPDDRIKIGRIWAENGWTGMVMSPLVQSRAEEDASPPGAVAKTMPGSSSTDTGANSALETLKSVNEAMRTSAEADRQQGLIELFRAAGPDARER
ncbi:pentapeptide repeat-containing protein [Sphingomonas sp. S2-65]|uniref:pentapeptide repeat-containing protein n=1 Tax=Sphingomonas sp. S2-65 TaxID=2903960 RepID=UPI001F3CA1F9|nr:pentapeptide repeat-containing protein [Sphingomonas sp. S2-65]UYY57142.1 pentapeptide repeat-containing protein [Sphingomonas sp. S2-65]